jgi:NAD(P)-dependent dehydrogenase (short-subunit alcohol dehydrogenase family)
LHDRWVTNDRTRTAVITGASRGLGLALATELAAAGWNLVLDARGAAALAIAGERLAGTGSGRVIALPGDVADAGHRTELVDAAAGISPDGLDLLVNNASLLGPSPLPRLADHPLDALAALYQVNVLAPLALLQQALPLLLAGSGRVLNISSDAAVEAYPGWGGYGSSKAALDQLTAVLAVELPQLRIHAVDPGDMNTAMHAAAFPGEDISDRPSPESVLPALLRLITTDLPSGRYRAADLLAGTR